MTESNHIQEYSAIYNNVRECILIFADDTQKVIVSDGSGKQLTVNLHNNHLKNPDFVEKVLNHYQSSDTLPELAAKCGFNSTKTFTRYFKKNFNTTPKQWEMEMKKELMICKLKHTDLTLKQIAAELGFLNVSHLSNFCLKKTGKRPKEIRKSR